MSNFIKKWFSKKPKQTTKEVSFAASSLVVSPLMIEISFSLIIKKMQEERKFNKPYKCVSKYLEKYPYDSYIGDRFTLNELSFVLTEDNYKVFYESKIVTFAKKYSTLHCKSSDELFDSLMKRLASIPCANV